MRENASVDTSFDAFIYSENKIFSSLVIFRHSTHFEMEGWPFWRILFQM